MNLTSEFIFNQPSWAYLCSCYDTFGSMLYWP